MTELGSRLRSEREEKGLTLDDLAGQTRIQKRYLQAIEEGDYSNIPGKFYTRAFIKQYAEAVGLDPNDMFEEYKNDIPIAYEENLTEQLSRVKARNDGAPRYSKLLELLPRIIIILIIIAVLIGIYFAVIKFMNPGKGSGTEDKPPITLTESEEKPKSTEKDQNKAEDGNVEKDKDDKDETDEEDKPTQKVEVTNVTGIETTYELSDAEQFVIEVKAKDPGESWVTVRDETNKALFDNSLVNGQSETFTLDGQKEIFIRIGRSTETEVYVNDELIQFELNPEENIVQNIKIINKS